MRPRDKRSKLSKKSGSTLSGRAEVPTNSLQGQRQTTEEGDEQGPEHEAQSKRIPRHLPKPLANSRTTLNTAPDFRRKYEAGPEHKDREEGTAASTDSTGNKARTTKPALAGKDESKAREQQPVNLADRRTTSATSGTLSKSSTSITTDDGDGVESPLEHKEVTPKKGRSYIDSVDPHNAGLEISDSTTATRKGITPWFNQEKNPRARNQWSNNTVSKRRAGAKSSSSHTGSSGDQDDEIDHENATLMTDPDLSSLSMVDTTDTSESQQNPISRQQSQKQSTLKGKEREMESPHPATNQSTTLEVETSTAAQLTSIERSNSKGHRRRSSTPKFGLESILEHATYIGSDGRGNTEDLDSRYYVRHSSFFCKGRAFAMLWHESNESKKTTRTELSIPDTYIGKYNQKIFTTVRRMVVVRESHGHCLCIPIVTYNNQGALKRGLSRAEVENHTVVYMRGTKPDALPEEKSRGMHKDPIALQAANVEQKLKAMSRINFDKPYTVEHNIKVMDVGKVVHEDMHRLDVYFFGTFTAPQPMQSS